MKMALGIAVRVLAVSLVVGGAMTAPTDAAPVAVTASTAASAGPAAARDPLLRRLRRIPIVESVEEKPHLALTRGSRVFRFKLRLPADRRDPDGPSFLVRAVLVHRGLDRPTVLKTSGYGLSGWQHPFPGEVAMIVGGNQLEVEHRFFLPSRPQDPDWPTQLTIRQSAADQHRIVRAFQRVYAEKWLATGASKGGMTMTYFRRFHPEDVAGTVAFVAPNDADETEDSAYPEFLATVGGDRWASCRTAIEAVQRRLLEERDWFEARLATYVEEQGYTLRLVPDVAHAVEIAAVDVAWAFWQYGEPRWDCESVPTAEATRGAVWRWVDRVQSWSWSLGQGTSRYTPYFYQAATQLGSPSGYGTVVADLLEFPAYDPATFVPDRLEPLTFDPEAMADVDGWVRTEARRMMFIYGGRDPYSAEPFDCGPDGDQRACSVLTVAGGNHGAQISDLPSAQRHEDVVTVIRRWVGLATKREQLERIRRALDAVAEHKEEPGGRLPGLPAGD